MKKNDLAAAFAAFAKQNGIDLEGSADAAAAPTATVRKSKTNASKPSTVNPASYRVTTSTYKGFPVVTFVKDGARPISLGHSKIRMVLAHADALRKIVG